MDIDNTFIRPILLFHFGKGKNEIETHEEIVKQYGKYAISLKTINKWFGEFKKGKHTSSQVKPDSSKKKLTDEYIIKLVDANPQLTMEELGKLAGVNKYYISRRLKQINREEEIAKYVYKNRRNNSSKTNGLSVGLTDEFLIDLIDKNPDFSMTELAKTAGVSKTTISRRLKNINSDEEKVKYVYKTSRKRYSETSTKLELIPKQTPIPTIKFTDEYLIDLINESPELSIKELADIIGTTSGIISRRIRKVKKNGGKINYTSKSNENYTPETNEKSHPKAKFTNEFLIQLINENPHLNVKELADVISVSASAVSRRIKQINIKEGKEIYSKKNLLNFKENPESKLDLSEEFIIDMVNKNPDLRLRELAALVKTSTSNLSKKIKKINWVSARTNYGDTCSKQCQSSTDLY